MRYGDPLATKHQRFFGVGIYDAEKDGHLGAEHHRDFYNMWLRMLTRVYSEASLKKCPTYEGCSVDARFHRFTDFFAWASLQQGFGRAGFELDKDVLVKRNKVYSPETCAFVPKEINHLLLSRARGRGALPIGVSKQSDGNKFNAQCRKGGRAVHLGSFDTPELAFAAYKKFKEQAIRECAEKHKASISQEVYLALMNYKVEITD